MAKFGAFTVAVAVLLFAVHLGLIMVYSGQVTRALSDRAYPVGPPPFFVTNPWSVAAAWAGLGFIGIVLLLTARRPRRSSRGNMAFRA